jgi:hypothetical protein
MYTENEFKDLVSIITQDFAPKTFEFWSYVEDKLKAFVGKIQKVYRDEICEGREKALRYLSIVDRENFLMVKKLVDGGAVFEATEDSMLVAESASWIEAVKKLVDGGAVFEATEDSMLVAESASWIEAIRHNPLDTVSLEMLQETVRERDDVVSRRIEETFHDEETGVLFIKPNRAVDLNGRVKVIRVCRFDPADYLRSWQVQLKATRP